MRPSGIEKRSHDLARRVDAISSGAARSRAGDIDRRERAVRKQKAVRPNDIGKPSHDLARFVDIRGPAFKRAIGLDRSERAAGQQKAMRGPRDADPVLAQVRRIDKGPHDLA